MRGRESAVRISTLGSSWRRGALAVPLFALPLGCSGEFTDCESARTCEPSLRGAGGGSGDGSVNDASRTPQQDGAGGARRDAGGSVKKGGNATSGSDAGGRAGSGGAESEDSSVVERGLEAGPPPSSDGGGTTDATDATDAADATPTCNDGFSRCGGAGCDVDLERDPDNCGACGHPCSTNQASARACVAGVCQPTCKAHHDDCSTPASADDDGCETDLGLATSCGACAHDCLGGACSNERCQVLALATGLETPIALTVDAKYVHWIDGGLSDGRVVRSPVLGGGATPLFTGQALPGDIASDGVYVYWTNSRQGSAAIQRVLSGGSTALPVVTTSSYPALGAPGPLAVDGTSLYFGDFATSRGFKVAKDGTGAPAMITPAFNVTPFDVAVDATEAYFALFDLLRVPLAGSTTAAAVALGYANTSYVALDDAYVYFVGYDKVLQRTSVSRTPKTGSGAAEVVTADAGIVHAMAVDEAFVYYADASGLYRVTKSGGNPEPLSTVVSNPVSIAVRAGAVYWANEGDPSAATGSIYKLAL